MGQPYYRRLRAPPAFWTCLEIPDPRPDSAREDQPMSCVTDLSIFSFGQAAHSNNRSASQAGASQGNSTFADNDGDSLPPGPAGVRQQFSGDE